MWPLLAVLMAAAPGPDPARLSSARYSDAGDVQRIRAASWRPSDPRNGGRSVRFTAPGRMILDWRTDGATCNFASRRAGDSWTLIVDCGAGPAHARWTWLPDGRARTSVFQVAAPQLEGDVELVRFDRGFAEVEKQFRADYRQKALQFLAGQWKDASWETDLVLDPGRLSLNGKPAQVQAEPCLPLAQTAALPVICLTVTADGTPRLQLVEQGQRLFECEWDAGPEGAQFDLAKGSRIFSRAPVASTMR